MWMNCMTHSNCYLLGFYSALWSSYKLLWITKVTHEDEACLKSKDMTQVFSRYAYTSLSQIAVSMNRYWYEMCQTGLTKLAIEVLHARRANWKGFNLYSVVPLHFKECQRIAIKPSCLLYSSSLGLPFRSCGFHTKLSCNFWMVMDVEKL